MKTEKVHVVVGELKHALTYDLLNRMRTKVSRQLLDNFSYSQHRPAIIERGHTIPLISSHPSRR